MLYMSWLFVWSSNDQPVSSETSSNLHNKIITSQQSSSTFEGTPSLHVHILKKNPDQLLKRALFDDAYGILRGCHQL